MGLIQYHNSILLIAFQLQTTNAALPIRVKLSGDGARLSRSSTLVLLSFSLPGLQTNMLAASGKVHNNNNDSNKVLIHKYTLPGNHTFAAIRAEESYENLSTGFGEVTDDLNALLENPTITIDAVQYPLEIFLGSDYKVQMQHVIPALCFYITVINP